MMTMMMMMMMQRNKMGRYFVWVVSTCVTTVSDAFTDRYGVMDFTTALTIPTKAPTTHLLVVSIFPVENL